jgi:uncharacterized NAD(P)/FAD-binding protein YdhS
MSHEPGGPTEVDVAIVGGGAAGVLVATRLLADPDSRLRVAIVEPAAELARGAAYATAQPEHLLNVVAGGMSAFAEDPAHFVRFLSESGDPAVSPTAFVARRDYGRYLRETLCAQPRYPSLRWLRERVVDIERQGHGNRLDFASGQALTARVVVLAVGNTPRRIPASRLHGSVRLAEAWDYAAVATIPACADVCIVGSGLSMVDAVLGLAHGGHQGRIHVVSRHGLMPLAHAAPGAGEGTLGNLLALGLRDRLRLVRAWTRAATTAGEPWQWVFDRLRPHGQALWRSLTYADQQRFLRHVVRYWDIHRHRIAPQVAATLDGLRAGGRLDAVAGRLQSIEARADGSAEVAYRPRHEDGVRTIRADWIVNATGVETHIDLQPDTLLGALRMRGRVLPGPHGIGIASEEPGRVLDARGVADPGLLVLGAMRIGTLWESIAIPELRGQARAIAEHLRALLDERPAAPMA